MRKRNVLTDPEYDEISSSSFRDKSLELENLSQYAMDLEMNISLNRQLAYDLLYGRKGGDETISQGALTGTLVEKLGKELEILEKRHRALLIEKLDAENKARDGKAIIDNAGQREADIYREFQGRLNKCIKESEEKEKMIIYLEAQNREFEEMASKFTVQKETPVDQEDLEANLQTKNQRIAAISNKLKLQLEETYQQNNQLITHVTDIHTSYIKALEALHGINRWNSSGFNKSFGKDQTYSRADVANIQYFIQEPAFNISYDEFWTNFENDSWVQESEEEVFDQASNRLLSKALSMEEGMMPPKKKPTFLISQSKKEKAQRKVEENYIKLETLNQELLNAKRLYDHLEDDNQRLKAALQKIILKETDLQDKLKKLTVSYDPPPVMTHRVVSKPKKVRRCNSNPLDYGLEVNLDKYQEYLSREIENNKELEGLNDDSAVIDFSDNEDKSDLPSFIVSHGNVDMFAGDSVLMDIFF